MSTGDGRRRQINGWFPEELTIETLSRLPSPATVGRCRCVSRSWRRILSDPEFITTSIMPPPPRTARVMIASSTTTPFSIHSADNLRLLDSGCLPTDSGFGFIAGCADGMFCVGTCDVKVKIVLWNPTNSETYTLPPIPPPDGGHRRHFVAIGFGFDPVTRDYKVLISSQTHGHPPTALISLPALDSQFLVYSLRGNSYRRIEGVPMMFAERVVRSLSASPARCHWMSRSLADYDYFSLGSFDMSKEAFTELWLPEWPSEGRLMKHSFHMARDESCLVVVSAEMDQGKGMMDLDVWATPSYVALARGICSWIRLYNVQSCIPAVVQCSSSSCLPVPGIWKQGKLFVKCAMNPGGEQMRVFDLETKEWGLDLEIKSNPSGTLHLSSIHIVFVYGGKK